MPVQDLVELLKNNPYPGRGIVVGKDTVYYFIMGRSVNSRNRIFAIEPDGIRTEAHDPALLEDPEPHHLPPGAHDGRRARGHQRRSNRHHRGGG